MTLTSHHPVEIVAGPENKGERVDQFLTKKLPEHSRSAISKLIKTGFISRVDAPIKASQLITGTEIFLVTKPEQEPWFMVAQNIPLEILYNDEHIAVINKPAGLVVHPGAGVKDGTLCNALLYHFPEIAIGDTTRPGIVHRLDKETSGLMVIAKTERALRSLSEDFKERRVTKIYRAFCIGEFFETSFELKTGHVRHPFHRLKFLTKLPVSKIARSEVRTAHTSFTVLRSAFGMASVKATLHTGRTHQIRAHLADIDHPLLGDELYGGKRPFPKAPDELKDAIACLTGQALHAESLSFVHPITKERIDVNAPLPASLEKIDRYFR